VIKYPDQAVLVKASKIDIADRVRQDYGDVADLADSIATHGLLHPPVINHEHRLIGGGRRFKAMTEVLGLTEIPVMFLEVLSESALRTLEAEENVQRKQMSWQETVQAITLVHEAREREALLSDDTKKTWTTALTGKLIGVSRSSISYALSITSLIRKGDKQIIAADSLTEAIRITVKRREDEAVRSLVSSAIPQVAGSSQVNGLDNLLTDLTDFKSRYDDDDAFFSASPAMAPGFATGSASRPAPETPQGETAQPQVTVPISSMVHHTDSIKWMHDHPGCCDHIVTDIPYGIDMKNLQQTNTGMDVSHTAAEHDVKDNVSLMRQLFLAAHAALRDNGFFVLWCDLDHWNFLTERARVAGFKVQSWPLIWSKSHQCMNQMAQYNFTKNFEVALICRKGNATLQTNQPSSVWTGSGLDEKTKYGHPFAKPIKLWHWVYNAVAMRGQTVLDPFCGSGTASCAAITVGLTPIALDINDTYVQMTKDNLMQQFTQSIPNVQFK